MRQNREWDEEGEDEEASPSQSVLSAFESLQDPRRVKACCHTLEEILLGALCAISSGANSWVMVETWCKFKLEWLRGHLPYANGVPSHDTFSRVFNLLEPSQFEACFIAWMQQLCPSLKDQQICIDGKTVRGSQDGPDVPPIHLVSAWAHAAGLVLGQIKTDVKSSEVTAIPELLDKLNVQGALVTLDAVSCHRGIVRKIVQRQADYVVAVKGNQPSLEAAVQSMFGGKPAGAQGLQHTQRNKGHGRKETRCCTVVHELSAITEALQGWTNVRSVVRVQSTRELPATRHKPASTSAEVRYYISSLQLDAQEFSERIRAHWGIENSCHWVMDMTFSEDASRVRSGHGAQNIALLRRISLNLIKRETSGKKTSLAVRRYRATLSTDYLEIVLGMRAAPS